MGARPILIALVAAAALILFCLRFVGGPTSGTAGVEPVDAAAAPAERADGAIVGGVVREERVGVADEDQDALPAAAVLASDDVARATREEDAPRSEDVLVRGVCYDAVTRTPVAGVALRSGVQATTSGDDGAFEMAWPSRGRTAYLVVQHADYVEQRVPVEHAAAAPAGAGDPDPDETAAAVVAVEVHLRRGLPLALEVVDAVTGSPVVGATLAGESTDHPCAVADERGRLGLRVLPGASFTGTLDADGYAALRWSWRVDEDEAGERDVVPLVPAAWLAGRVVDGEGRGLAGAALVAYQQQVRPREYAETVVERWGDVLVPGELRFRIGSQGRGHAEADATGSFRMAVPPSASPFALSASHRGHVDAGVDGLLVDEPGKRADVEIVLARGASIDGRITRNDEPWDGQLVGVRADGSEHHANVRGGRYRIGDLAPGALRLTIESALSGGLVFDETVELEPGGALRKDIAFHEPFATIEGAVVRADGAPAVDVIVGARPDGRGERTVFWTRSDEEGAFVLEVPPEGIFDVSAYDRVERVWQHDLSAGARDVTFVLGETGTLELALVDATTQSPIATDQRRFLSWSASGDLRSHRLTARLGGDGTTTLTLPAGRIDLTVDLTRLGYARRTLSSVLVRPGGDTLRVALERGVDVRLTLDARSARRLRRHAVFLLEEGQRDLVRGPFEGVSASSNTRINGRRLWVDASVARQRVDLGRRRTVVLQGLLPGRYVLRCFPDDVRLEPETIDLMRPGVTEVQLELVR